MLGVVLLTPVFAVCGQDLPHPDDLAKQQEHLRLFEEVVPRGQATHQSVRSGNWNATSTWQNGQVPSAGARVLIAAGHTVQYNIQSDTAIRWVRVDGGLTFRHDIDTRLVVESLVVDPAGLLEIGTPAQPIQSGRQAEIVIDTSGGPINASIDTFHLGRGVISHGQTTIQGAAKTAYTTLQNSALSGTDRLVLFDSAIPAGWQVGDILVVAGTEVDLHDPHGFGPTNHQGVPNLMGEQSASVEQDKQNERFKDEIVEITSMEVVNGRVQVRFRNLTNESATAANRTTLLWDHKRPDGDLFNPWELGRIHVANLTRNVIIRSSDPTVDTQERGHFMVMHNPHASIHGLLAKDLGRTDKSIRIDDPVAMGDKFTGEPSTGTNPRGRYGIHLHRTGSTSHDGPRAEVVGCVVWGTPGWGIVHHDSNALLEDNIVFDVIGAGIVAEDGSELGIWRRNLVIKSTGEPDSDFDDNEFLDSGRGSIFDLGFVGSGYWIQGGGAGLIIENNTAVSCNAAGFDVVNNNGLTPLPQYGRNFPSDLIRNSAMRDDLLAADFPTVPVSSVSTRIRGLVVYNSFRGIHTWQHKRMDGFKEYRLLQARQVPGGGRGFYHDYHLILEDFKLWNVMSGVQNFYSSSVTHRNGLVVGDPENPVLFLRDFGAQDNNRQGLGFSSNGGDATYHHFDNIRIEGFEYGVRIPSSYNKQREKYSPYAVSSMRACRMANVWNAFLGVGDTDSRFNPDFILENDSTFSTLTDSTPPVAAFTAVSAGGFGMLLDATASFDSDPHRLAAADDPGLAAYAWDFNNDGTFDAWGDQIVHHFGSSGNKQVRLTVYDSHGGSSSIQQTVSVTAQPYPNNLIDSDFNEAAGAVIDTKRYAAFKEINSMDRNDGWLGDNLINNGGFLTATGVPKLVQVFRDEWITTGEQTVDLRIKQTGNGSPSKDLWVTVYGVNGQFSLVQDAITDDAIYPPAGSIIPVEYAVLLRENIGGPQYANWKNLSFAANFGPGFEYIVVHLSGDGQNIGGGDTFAIDRMRITGEAPGSGGEPVDLALGQPAKWGHPWAPNWSNGKDAASIVDGDPATGQGTHTGNHHTWQWLGVDLGSEQTIHSIYLLWHDANHRAVDYELQTSSDGWNWNTVQTITANSDIERTHPVGTQSGRYFRVKVNLGGFGEGGLRTRVILKDLQVLGLAN